VDVWGVDDVEQELRQRFGSGTTALDIGDFELELVEDGEIWIDGDSHDVVMRAIGRLAREDQYVIVKGNEILDKPQSDATVRDVGGAEVVGASSLVDRIETHIDDDGYANLDTIIGEVRAEESVFPPAGRDRVRRPRGSQRIPRRRLRLGSRWSVSWIARRPRSDDGEDRPDRSRTDRRPDPEYIEDLEPGDQFTVNKVGDRFDSSVTEYMVRTYLLENIGKDEEPEYVVNTTGSEKASDWVPGYPFRKADTEIPTWRFEYNGDDVAAMRSKWRNNHQTGSVDYGDVTFMLPDREGVPGALQGTADVERTQVSLTLRSDRTTRRSKTFSSGCPMRRQA